MIEEVSEKTGEKPFLIEPVGDDLLCQFLFGKNMKEAKEVEDEFSIIEDEEED